ncbi:MAG TPA: carbon-nitrogen hydrolase family protein [Cyclobacteriaceae bacterium]
MSKDQLKVALAQIVPVWLNKDATTAKVKDYIIEAGENNCDLVAFGEGLLPGYPFWIEHTDGARFESTIQKEIHAHYLKNAIQIESGDLNEICDTAKKHRIAVYLGIIERALNRGGHSLYASLVYIDPNGGIQSVHRKLQPTYEERLTWSPGDGHGLRTHNLKSFCLGGLNCWENWMPLPRAALYGLGENVHIAVWPGSERNTKDITRFIAKESRAYVLSVSGLMRKTDFPENVPHYDKILKNVPEVLTDGGSCVAAPDGNWIIEPVRNKVGLIMANLELDRIYEERQNFDPSGHYSRPDVTQLMVNRERQAVVNIKS